MRGHLLLTNCIEDEVTRPNIELALKEDKLLWLDLRDTDEETLVCCARCSGSTRSRSRMSRSSTSGRRSRITTTSSPWSPVDSYRDLLSGSLDAYMSMVSNRLNDVMKQLTIIATVFLPLSFLTGFFGQDFAWLVNRIGAEASFFGVGVGTEVLAVAALLLLFKRRGWMGKSSLPGFTGLTRRTRSCFSWAERGRRVPPGPVQSTC